MKYGVSHISIIPLRKEAADSSEMVSQLLFGEHYKVIKEQVKWVYIRSAHDKYEGWIDRNQFLEISEDSFKKLDKEQDTPVAHELAAPIEIKENATMFPILMGSSLPKIPELEFNYSGEVTEHNTEKGNRKKLVENAFMFLNAPYLWGGRSPFGIDCSGFSQIVYKLNHISLPRDAWQQSKKGQSLSFIEEANEGDLAFFDNSDGQIIHVGIMLNNNQIIHASGKVRIDKIDHQGIYNTETRSYSHHLRLIKNIIED